MVPISDRFFELIDGVLYVFMKAIKEAGLSVGYYQKLNSEGSDKTMLHPKNKKIILVRYDCINEANKQKITERFGCNPYDYIARDPIRRMITPNQQAKVFFLGYRYSDKTLPLHRVKQYARACDILELIKRIDESRNKLIKDLGISVPVFYEHLKAIITAEKVNGESDTYEGANQLYARFPTKYDNIRSLLTTYKEQRYECVIDKSYGNTGALKVKTTDAQDFLIELLKNPLQYNDVLVAMIYNTKAKQEEWPEISPQTVQLWRKKYAAEITTEREGVAAYNGKYIRQVKGTRPSAPLYLVEHDDNNLDFLYQDTDGSQYNRYVSIVVTDSHCDLVLGKSVIHGHSPEPWQVQHAYIDAMYYIRSLTGGWYKPHEFKADKWALKALAPLYEKLGKNVTPSHGNKHRGYIEQFFRTPLWKNCQKLVSQGNYNGNNMTAKFRGFNPDMLDMSLKEKSRPMVGDQAELQIEQFFYLLRNMSDFKRNDLSAPSKQQKWLQAWNAMSIEQKNPITDEEFLLTFGITHTPRHKDTIRITNRGVEPQINNTKYSYDLPETWMYNKLQGADVKVIYDPFDMSRVLVTNENDIRFIAKTAQLVPRALEDHHTGSRTFLNSLLDEKQLQVKQVADKAASRKRVDQNHAAAMLQSGMILPKEIKNKAEQKMIEQDAQQYEQYLDTNLDINEYLNP